LLAEMPTPEGCFSITTVSGSEDEASYSPAVLVKWATIVCSPVAGYSTSQDATPLETVTSPHPAIVVPLSVKRTLPVAS
jgi:hypothetical protein